MAFGVASWRGMQISFTDGMCRRCAVSFRHQWKLPLPAPPLVPRFGLLRVAGTLMVVTGLLLAARPFEGPRAPATMTPPPETVLVPAPIELQSPPPVDVPRAPRRTRTAPPPRVAAVVVTTPAEAAPEPAPEPAPVVADSAPEPVVTAALPEAPVVTVADPPVELPSASAGRRRSPASWFASLPHAGLTQQTP